VGVLSRIFRILHPVYYAKTRVHDHHVDLRQLGDLHQHHQPAVTLGVPQSLAYSVGPSRIPLRLGLAAAISALVLSGCGSADQASPPTTGANPAVLTATATTVPTASPTPAPTPLTAQPPAAPAAVQPALANADPYPAATAAGASAVCADRSWSYSKHRSGTCSSHGGVHWWTGNLGAAGPGAH